MTDFECVGGRLERWTRDNDPRPDDLVGSSGLDKRRGVRGSGAERGLTRTIESEIIPRLMLSATVRNTQSPGGAMRATDADVGEICRLAVRPDNTGLLTCVAGLRQRGMSVQTVLLDLLAPAARRLGQLWEEDLCDFVDVTIGVANIQTMMHELCPHLRAPAALAEDAPTAMLLPSAGEQHTLGIFMVEEMFRSAGWDVWGDARVEPGGMRALVESERFDLVGFSLSAIVHRDILAADIQAVRELSRNAAVKVLVGGPAFVSKPELAAEIGADATAKDALTALKMAQTMVDLSSRQRASPS